VHVLVWSNEPWKFLADLIRYILEYQMHYWYLSAIKIIHRDTKTLKFLS
jgi:hypothetical protein